MLIDGLRKKNSAYVVNCPIAEWLKQQAGKQSVIGSILRGGTYFHFRFLA